jgi:hypothetical protein
VKILIISYLFAVFFILAILADRLPFFNVINRVSNLGNSSLQTIRSRVIEDSKKQKILLCNSLSILRQSFRLTAFILVILVCGFLLLVLSRFVPHLGFQVLFDYFKTTGGIILSMVSFASYYLVKKLYVKITL